MSWISRGLSWGPTKDVPVLQSRIQNFFEGDFSLIMVAQVMLVQPRRAVYYTEFPRLDARGDVQIILRTPNRVSGYYRGRGPEQ